MPALKLPQAAHGPRAGWREAGTVVALVALAVLGAVAWWAGAQARPVWLLLLWAPLVEEAVFRAGLQEALLQRRVAQWAANVLTALVFALAHAVLRADPGALAVAAPALLAGAVYGRWRRLRWCVALHAAMNAAWLAWSWLAPAPAWTWPGH